MAKTGKILTKDAPNGKSRYVWRHEIYERDPLVEKFLGQGDGGWKIHLNIPADKNQPLTKEISNFLNQHPYVHQYKIGWSGEEEDGTGITIYVGSWDRTAALAHRLHEVFGGRLPEAKAWPDIRMVGNIAARFECVRFANGKYRQYGSLRGLPDLSTCTYDRWNPPASFTPAERRKYGLLAIGEFTNDFGDYLWGTGGTEKFVRHGIAGLPRWAQVWAQGEDAPFDVEAALPPRPEKGKKPWKGEHFTYK